MDSSIKRKTSEALKPAEAREKIPCGKGQWQIEDPEPLRHTELIERELFVEDCDENGEKLRTVQEEKSSDSPNRKSESRSHTFAEKMSLGPGCNSPIVSVDYAVRNRSETGPNSSPQAFRSSDVKTIGMSPQQMDFSKTSETANLETQGMLFFDNSKNLWHSQTSPTRRTMTSPNITEFSPLTTNGNQKKKSTQTLAGTLTNLTSSMKSSIQDNQVLEEKRRSLALRYDFCLTEFFQIIAHRDPASINLDDLIYFGHVSNVNLSKEDWAIIVVRYDRDRDGALSFHEFCDLFGPYNVEYRKRMNKRSNMNKEKFSLYTVQTAKLLKDILYTIVICEENFLHNSVKVSEGLVGVSNKIFEDISGNGKESLDFEDFWGVWAKCKSYKVDRRLLRILFDQFDRDKDGVISFYEFFAPTYGGES